MKLTALNNIKRRAFEVALVFHATAPAFDDDGLGMMHDAIEQRGGQ
ncbi:hypothetical protein [Paraburkholderia sp. CNPSo 3281]|nr:hypothetical protein [Paraburkholderia sp. CNPSo 3281]MCP3715450.1 hypothetical protein [Paraburkholderia sp. CNPSo 3281]